MVTKDFRVSNKSHYLGHKVIILIIIKTRMHLKLKQHVVLFTFVKDLK